MYGSTTGPYRNYYDHERANFDGSPTNRDLEVANYSRLQLRETTSLEDV
jgi:hypothetical protein